MVQRINSSWNLIYPRGERRDRVRLKSITDVRWGQQSNRTSFYKVPLIVISSVILAVAIVVGIIM